MLKCDPKAFTSTESYTLTFSLTWWDLSDHDFTYLENFAALGTIFVAFSDKFFDSWHRLPPLQNLAAIFTSNCDVVGEINLFPPELPSLQELVFTNDLLDDTSAASLLDWFLSTSSDTRDIRMDLSMNALTVVPSQLSAFSNLQRVYMSDNSFGNLSAGSFNFLPSAAIQAVDVSYCRVEAIEPGAFAGRLRLRAVN